MTIATAMPTAQTLIMAGGRGERLYPLTASRPKPAVPFGGIFRIVDFTLSNCLNSGLKNVTLLTQYKHEELQSYIRQGWSRLWSGYSPEPLVCLPPRGEQRYRGTADAVFQNMGELESCGPEPVLILSADHVYHMDYRRLLSYHADTKADLTIATVEHALTAAKDYGVVEVDDELRVVGFQEKPATPCPLPSNRAGALINMGVYVFKRELLMNALNENCNTGNGFDFGHHIIPSLIGSAHIRAYEFRDEAKQAPRYWRDIGTIDAYYETNMDLVRPGKRFDPYANPKWPSYPSSRAHSSRSVRARLLTRCRVRRSILSPGVQIEEGGVIESSVLMSGVSVGKDARIRHAIIEEGVQVPAGVEIGFDLDNDRKYHFVTASGVVVVTQAAILTETTVATTPRQTASKVRLFRSA